MNHTHSFERSEPRWLAGIAAAGGVPGLRHAMQAQSGLDIKNLRSLAIVGAAAEGQRLARICVAQGIKIDAIVDDDPAKERLARRRFAGRTGADVDGIAKFYADRYCLASSFARHSAFARSRL